MWQHEPSVSTCHVSGKSSYMSMYSLAMIFFISFGGTELNPGRPASSPDWLHPAEGALAAIDHVSVAAVPGCPCVLGRGTAEKIGREAGGPASRTEQEVALCDRATSPRRWGEANLARSSPVLGGDLVAPRSDQAGQLGTRQGRLANANSNEASRCSASQSNYVRVRSPRTRTYPTRMRSRESADRRQRAGRVGWSGVRRLDGQSMPAAQPRMGAPPVQRPPPRCPRPPTL